MSEIFDVDCPRTPDEDCDDSKRINGKPSNSLASGPPPRSRTASATALSRARSHGVPCTGASGIEVIAGYSAERKTMFSPRPRGGKLARASSSAGLEPEEYIAPAPLPPRRSPAAAAPRAPNSATGAYHAAPNSGNKGGAHSTEVFGAMRASTNPFDTDGSSRGRTYSGNLWREEIINEGDEKASEYYGLDSNEKKKLYGPATKSTTAIITNAVDVEQGFQASQEHRLSDLDDMPGLQGNDSNGINTNIPLNTNIYRQAASMNSAGYYNTNVNVAVSTVDDYSFSNVDLGNLPPGTTFQGNIPPGISNVNKDGKETFRDKLLQWCISALTATSSSNNYGHGHLPPNTNGPSSSSDWVVAKDIQNKKQGCWNRLGQSHKMGLGLLWMVLVCTIFGVTVSELKKANTVSNVESGGSQSHGFGDVRLAPPAPEVQLAPPAPEVQLAPPAPELESTPEPTLQPSIYPTAEPTPPTPTKMPATENSMADNYAVHSKTSDESGAIIRPTQSPVTNWVGSPRSVSGSPTVKIASVQAAPGGEGSCTDNNDGFFLNHLGNLFNCTWLHNGKSGRTDRKDKNCGGVPVVDTVTGGTMVYDTSELGRECPETCSLYNSCAESGTVAASDDFFGMTPMGDDVDSRVFSACHDSQGYFFNHLSNPMTCEWLYNDKPGKTDRKDKNCGTVDYPVTDLGMACKSTCSIYNTDECTGGEVTAMMAFGGEHKDNISDMAEQEELEESGELEELTETEETDETEEMEEMEETEETEETEDTGETEETGETGETEEQGEVEEKISTSSPAEKNATEVLADELVSIMDSGQVMRSYSSPSYSFSLKTPNEDRR